MRIPWIGSREYWSRASWLAGWASYGQCGEPRTIGRTVRIDGRTDLHNYYPESWQRNDYQRGQRNGATVYTTRRTRSRALSVARLHAKLAEGQRVYLLTFTMNLGEWDRTPLSDGLRRHAFRVFLDNFRKTPGLAGFMWTTERHKSGLIHHHVVARFTQYWDYTRVIKRWSLRYCGTPNGLDVAPPKDKGAAFYTCKGFKYATKNFAQDTEVHVYERSDGQEVRCRVDTNTGELKESEPDELAFRWWGTSKVVRQFEVPDDELPVLFSYASGNQWAKCARVPTDWAIAQASRLTRQEEAIRARGGRLRIRRRLRTLQRRIKPPGVETNEPVPLFVPRGADDPSGRW